MITFQIAVPTKNVYFHLRYPVVSHRHN